MFFKTYGIFMAGFITAIGYINNIIILFWLGIITATICCSLIEDDYKELKEKVKELEDSNHSN